MGYKWLPVTEDFDKTLVIKKWRFDVSIPIYGNYDGALSELPNIDIKTCWGNPQASNGYAFSNRFNLGQKFFSSRYYGWTDKHWTATTEAHTTLVSGTTYEFECPVDLYWAGNYTTPWNTNIPNYMWFYVQASTFEITPTESAATYESGTTTITINTDNDSSITWTASTSDSWLRLSTLTGSGDGSVTVTYGENPTFQNRTGTVTFSSIDGDVLTFTIEQEKKPVLVYDHHIYRSGNLVKKMYRSGELIYLMLNPPSEEPEPPTPIDYKDMPLTFEITTAGNLKWYAQNGSYTKTIEYKKNDGEWAQITSSNAGTIIPVEVGDIVQFRGDNGQYAPQDGRCSCWCGTTANYKMYGNIMSLIDSTGFTTLSSFTQPNVFMNFFNSGGCIDAENLILPATALTNYCYQGMLAQSNNLQVGPLLPVETLVQGCYAYLFYHSYQINNIRCLAINKSASNCLQDWVNGAPSSGTFYKNPNMSSWNRGNSGVPNNWTLIDYTE